MPFLKKRSEPIKFQSKIPENYPSGNSGSFLFFHLEMTDEIFTDYS